MDRSFRAACRMRYKQTLRWRGRGGPFPRRAYRASAAMLRPPRRRASSHHAAARDARSVIFGHRLVEMLERPLNAFRGRRIAGVQPYGTILHFHWIDAQVVAAVNG